MGREGSHEPLLIDYRIQFTEGKLHVSDDPIIPFIEGDSIGPDMWAARVGALDAAVEKAFGGRNASCRPRCCVARSSRAPLSRTWDNAVQGPKSILCLASDVGHLDYPGGLCGQR